MRAVGRSRRSTSTRARRAETAGSRAGGSKAQLISRRGTHEPAKCDDTKVAPILYWDRRLDKEGPIDGNAFRAARQIQGRTSRTSFQDGPRSRRAEEAVRVERAAVAQLDKSRRGDPSKQRVGGSSPSGRAPLSG